MKNLNTPTFDSNSTKAEVEQQPTTPPFPSSCNYFKILSKGKNIRKRPTVEEGKNEDIEDKSSVIYTKKKPAIDNNNLHFSTRPSKCNKATESNVHSKLLFHFESSKQIQIQNDSRATTV